MVSNGGRICLDGRDGESHPYSFIPKNSSEKVKMYLINKNIVIQGWFSRAHIFCKRFCVLAFNHAKSRTLNLTLSNLAFHNTRVILRNVTCSNVVVSNCRFVNCTRANGIQHRDSRVFMRSSLVITDTKFLYNIISIYSYFFSKTLFILKISRCIFQGKTEGFKGTSQYRPSMTGAVYIGSGRFSYRVHVLGFITDSLFWELGHDYNYFALSFSNLDRRSTGYLTVLNTTFLNNKNAIYLYGGFDVRLTHVTINSTCEYAMTTGGFPGARPRVFGVEVFLDQSILGNNRVGITMAVTHGRKLVVKNTVFLGENETQGTGEAIKFQVNNDVRLVPSPGFTATMLLLKTSPFKDYVHLMLVYKIT